jgi:uncharacterized repeat protein (TIGR01451 family)
LRKPSKTSTAAPSSPAISLRYTLRLRAGTDPASINRVQDIFASPFLIPIEAFNNGTINGNAILWEPNATPELALLQPGQEVILAFTAQVSDAARDGEVISNQATLEANNDPASFLSDDPSTPAPLDPTNVIVGEGANTTLTALKTGTDDNGGTLQPGDTVTYTILVTNQGSTATTDARLEDAVPTFTTYVANSARIDGQPIPDGPGGASPLSVGVALQSVGQPSGVIPPGAAVAVTFQVRLLQAAPIGLFVTNQGRLTTSAPGVTLTDADLNTPEAEPTRLFIGDVATLTNSTKIANPIDANANGLIDVGEQIEFVITLRNDGTQPAQAVILTDNIAALGLVSYVPNSLNLNDRNLSDADDGDAGSFNGVEVLVGIPNLPIGDVAVLRFRVLANAQGVIDNQGRIQVAGLPDAFTDDPTTPIPSDPTRVVIGNTSDLAAFKTVTDANGGTFDPGDVVTYTFEIRNQNTTETLPIQFTDTFPVGVGGFSFAGLPAGAQSSVTDRSVFASQFQLAPGESVLFTVSATIAANATVGQELCNTAEVSTIVSTVPVTTNPACFTVGEGTPQGEGTVSGVMAWDQDGDRALTDADPRSWCVGEWRLA